MIKQPLKPGWTPVKFGDVVRQVKDKVDARQCTLDRYIAGEHMDTDDLRLRRWGEIKRIIWDPLSICVSNRATCCSHIYTPVH